jgi:hypothetical protein
MEDDKQLLLDIKQQVEDNSKNIQLILHKLSFIMINIEGDKVSTSKQEVGLTPLKKQVQSMSRHRSSSESLYKGSPKDSPRHKVIWEAEPSVGRVVHAQIREHKRTSPTKNSGDLSEDEGLEASEGYLTDDTATDRYNPHDDSVPRRDSISSATYQDHKGSQVGSDVVSGSNILRDNASNTPTFVSPVVTDTTGMIVPTPLPTLPSKAKKAPVRVEGRARKLSQCEVPSKR